jgi:hypothetical protein
VSDEIMWRRHRRTPGSGAAHRLSRHIILRSSSPAGPPSTAHACIREIQPGRKEPDGILRPDSLKTDMTAGLAGEVGGGASARCHEGD